MNYILISTEHLSTNHLVNFDEVQLTIRIEHLLVNKILGSNPIIRIQ